jgi:hypothetical protein
MSVLAFAIEQACNDAHERKEGYDIDRLSFLVARCGADLNKPFLIQGYPGYSGGARMNDFAVYPRVNPDYHIKATPLSRAMVMLEHNHASRDRIELFVRHMIEMGADPKAPLDYTIPFPAISRDEADIALCGKSLLYVSTMRLYSSNNRSMDFAVFLLKQGAGFIPADNAPLLRTAELAGWVSLYDMMTAFAPFYSQSSTGLFCKRDIAPTVAGSGMLHYLALHIPNNLDLLQNLAHLLIHVYGLSPLALNAEGRTPRAVLNQVVGMRDQVAWLRAHLINEEEAMKRHIAVAAQTQLQGYNIPMDTQVKIARMAGLEHSMVAASNAIHTVRSRSSVP